MKKAKLIFINLAVLLFLLIIVEIALRIAGLGYGDEPLENDRMFHHVFPADHRHVQYNLDQEFGGFEVFYDKNRRIANPAGGGNSNRDGRPGIVLLGDSFAVGKEVPWKVSYAAILQDSLTEYDIVNLAVTSYSPSVYYLQLKDFLLASGQKPAAVVILLYSNDVGNDSTYLSHAVCDETSGELLRLDGGKPNTLVHWLRKSYLARWVRKTQLTLACHLTAARSENPVETAWVVGGYLEPRPALEGTATETYLRKIVQLLTEANVCYFFSAVPSKYCHFNGISDSTSFDRRVKHWTEKNGVPYLDLTQSFDRHLQTHKKKCFFEKDIHFNENGHVVTANAMMTYLRNVCLAERK